MRRGEELAKFVAAAREMLARERDLAQFEIYCSSAEQIVVRLNYTSEIPSRGVEEAKSHSFDGFALRIVTRRDPHETGFGAEAGDLSLEGVRGALARARRALVADPYFSGLPAPPNTQAVLPPAPGLIRLSENALLAAGWRIIGGALKEFARAASDGLERPGLIIGGDLALVRDRIAIGGSNLSGILSDAGAHVRASITALAERLNAKGTATALAKSAAELRAAAAGLGAQAVARALELSGGERPRAGVYRVVLGPQPVAEILNYMVMGSLTSGAFFAASSAYQGRFGRIVMDRRLSLYDDPAGVVARRITCEGFRARRVRLVHDGRLSGLLSNVYDSHRLAVDPERAVKLGVRSKRDAKFAPLNGYRLGEGTARRFDAHAGSAGTNVVMRARGGVSEAELIRKVGDGVYVGRVWYTYPINGQRAGDFTCTVSGDSYVIRGGRLAAALAPNCLRINANLSQVFGRVLAAGRRGYPALVWGAPETYRVPALAVEGIALGEVGAQS